MKVNNSVSYESTLETLLTAATCRAQSPVHDILLDQANVIDRIKADIVYNAKRMAENHTAYARSINDGFFTTNSPAESPMNENMIAAAARLQEAHSNFRKLACAILTQDQWDEFNRLIRGE